MKKFFDLDRFDGDQGTLGIYVDLPLRSGPGNEFLPPRGDIGLAQNFREPKKAIAFATSPGLFLLLGPDAKFQRAELSPGSSEYRYPFRQDMSDSSGEELGTIDSITAGPKFTIDSNGQPILTGELDFSVDGDYTASGPNIGFTMHFYFNPKRNTKEGIAKGIVEWESDIHVDFGLLGTIILAVIGLIFLAAPLYVGASLGFYILVAAIASLVGGAFGLPIAEHFVSKAIAEKVDEQSQASVLDSLPIRLPAAFRRWDPFYETQHQIVAKLDEPMVIDQLGMAFTAKELVLDKQPVPPVDTAPRDEVRDNGVVTAIRYEVPDIDEEMAIGFEAKGPGVDRLDFVRADPVNEPTLVTLTLDQIVDRKAQKRVLAPIVLDAQRINMFEGQIAQLLCITWRIRTDQRNRLIGEFQRSAREDIETNELTEIEQKARKALTEKLHRPPTPEELGKEVELRIQSRIAELQKAYEDDGLRKDLHAALAPLLHFDLAPEELIALQEPGIFSLDGKEIIVRDNRNGTRTPYYRDHPDGDPRDNLLSLPHYTLPYAPPPP